MKEKKSIADDQLESYLYKIHGRFVNESDFYQDDPNATDEQKKAAYQKFVNLYIALYYEPLDEEYDEARYFTHNYDEALFKKVKYSFGGSRKISSINVTK